MSKYDVVVIGSGMGGLSASASLTKAGKKVLLLEKHSIPGGYATSFIRGRFEFEVSLHQLTDVGTPGNRGIYWMLMDAWGVTKHVEFTQVHELYRAIMPGIDMVVPLGRENYEKTLCDAFPVSAEGIKRFSALMFGIAEEASRARMEGLTPDTVDPAKYPLIKKYAYKTLDEVLKPLVPEEKAYDVLSVISGYMGHSPIVIPFLTFSMTVSSRIQVGVMHVKGRSQALSQAYIDTIEENGGEVWFNNGVTRILTDGRKIEGVLTEDGTKIDCNYVVCNVNPLTACLDLIGKDKVPDWYINRLESWTLGQSIVMVYLGLDCPGKDIGLTTHEIFWHGEIGYFSPSKTSIDFNSKVAAVTCYSASDPDFCPPGTSVVVVSFPTWGDAWLKTTPANYFEVKTRIAESALRIAERVAPGIRDHIEVMEIATPFTHIRYTGNHGGSFTGFDERHEIGSLPLPNRGPLEGLFFSNQWVGMGGGLMPTNVSAMLCTGDLLQDMAAGGRTAAVQDALKREIVAHTNKKLRTKESNLAKAREIINALHPSRIYLRVREIIEETDSTKTIRFEAAKGKLPYFRAGQYINLFVDFDGVRTSRPYSIASAPGKDYLDITVRRMEGGFVSHYLQDRVRVGDKFESSGPNGTFYYEPLIDSSDLVFLAGGSGITPFMSIIRDVTQKKLPVNIHLIYGSRIPEDIVYRKELDTIAAKHSNIKVDYVISEPPPGWKGHKGFMDKAMITSLVGKLEGKTFFMCGPIQMCTLCSGVMESLKIPAKRIRHEVFGAPRDISTEPGWPGIPLQKEFEVTEVRTGRKLKAKAGEPLMISLERAGIVIPAVCRSGECTACRTKLVSGKVFAPARVKHRFADVKSNYIHPCMSYPLENLQIRI